MFWQQEAKTQLHQKDENLKIMTKTLETQISERGDSQSQCG